MTCFQTMQLMMLKHIDEVFYTGKYMVFKGFVPTFAFLFQVSSFSLFLFFVFSLSNRDLFFLSYSFHLILSFVDSNLNCIAINRKRWDLALVFELRLSFSLYMEHA